MRHGWILAIALLASAPKGVSAQVNPAADSEGSWITPLGRVETIRGTIFRSFGQTFTTDDAHTELLQFSFWLVGRSEGDRWDFGANLLFSAYLMAWDGTRPVGDVLYKSAMQSGPSRYAEAYRFDTGNLVLQANQAYVAFLSAAEYSDVLTDGDAKAGMLISPDVYAGGEFVMIEDGGDFGRLTTTPWDRSLSGSDAAFQARFLGDGHLPDPDIPTVAPEPASMALLGTGLAGLAGVAKRRRRKTEAEVEG